MGQREVLTVHALSVLSCYEFINKYHWIFHIDKLAGLSFSDFLFLVQIKFPTLVHQDLSFHFSWERWFKSLGTAHWTNCRATTVVKFLSLFLRRFHYFFITSWQCFVIRRNCKVLKHLMFLIHTPKTGFRWIERQSSKSTTKIMSEHSEKRNCELQSNVKKLIEVHGCNASVVISKRLRSMFSHVFIIT